MLQTLNPKGCYFLCLAAVYRQLLLCLPEDSCGNPIHRRLLQHQLQKAAVIRDALTVSSLKRRYKQIAAGGRLPPTAAAAPAAAAAAAQTPAAASLATPGSAAASGQQQQQQQQQQETEGRDNKGTDSSMPSTPSAQLGFLCPQTLELDFLQLFEKKETVRLAFIPVRRRQLISYPAS